MTDAEKLQELEAMAQIIANVVNPCFEVGLEHGMVFAVLGFTVGPGGTMTWASNAERPGMVKALREMADKLEGELDMPNVPFAVQ